MAAQQPGNGGVMAQASPDAGPGAADLESLRARRKQAWADAQAAWARAQATWANTRATEAQAAKGFPKELLTMSPSARLRARHATMAVIELAKGILMAQQGCGEAEAFDLLRRASQRSNVPVRDLAERIVHSAPRHRKPRSTAKANAKPRNVA